jgi:uncharacterized protein
VYKLSRYLLDYPDPQGEGRIFVNTFHPAIDAVPQSVCERILQGDFGVEEKALKYLLCRGYVIPAQVDEDESARDELHMVLSQKPHQFLYYLMTTFACNFECPYCFQQNLKHDSGYISSSLLERIFGTIELFERSYTDLQSPRRSLLTVMGGETLLSPAAAHVRHCVETLLARAEALALDTIFYTNGFYLTEFASLLRTSHVNVTLDGPREVHNRRRMGPHGIDTFDRIIAGIRTFLTTKNDDVKLFLRINIDKDNLTDIHALIEYLCEQQMLQHSGLVWYPAVIVNHAGALKYRHFSDRLEVTRCILRIVRDRPEVLRTLNLNRFRGLQYVLDALLGRASEAYPQYFRCHSNYNGMSFDFGGNVYPCHACMDKQQEGIVCAGEAEDIVHSRLFTRWRSRNVFSLSKCQHCSGKYICLGGCPRECLEQNGSLMEPLCYPFREEIGLALDCFLQSEVREVWERMPYEQ